MEPPDDLEALRHFRHCLHKCFERRADALFELTDAITYGRYRSFAGSPEPSTFPPSRLG
jgi:hypothetical protein